MIVSTMVGTRVVQLCQVAAVWENVLEAILNLTEQQKVSALSPEVREQLSSQGQIQDFFRRGAPLRNGITGNNKPHFLQNTSCIRKLQFSSGVGGGAPPAHSP